MVPADKKDFFKTLAVMLAGYGKPMPDRDLADAWFALLMPFSPSTIAAGFAAYAAERPDFAPGPNGIAARCRLLDGRPSDDEAWALALPSADEQNTVVWTEEMARAFGICQTVLATGDEVGARMAFKDAYNRMVATARAAGLPAVWSVSAGWDGERRAVALDRAVAAGLLEAPRAALLLPNGAVDASVASERPEGLQRVLEALAELETPEAKATRTSQARIDAETARTQEIADQAGPVPNRNELLLRHPPGRA